MQQPLSHTWVSSTSPKKQISTPTSMHIDLRQVYTQWSLSFRHIVMKAILNLTILTYV